MNLFEFSNLVLAVVVSFFLHEYGHYITGRSMGANILGLFIGFPKPMSDPEFLAKYPKGGLIIDLTQPSWKFACGMVLPDDFYYLTDKWVVIATYLAGPMVNMVLFVVAQQLGGWSWENYWLTVNAVLAVSMLVPMIKGSDGWHILRVLKGGQK